MSNVTKDAVHDAAEFARAQMFYGEGAGIRRNHISTAVEYKMAKLPGYENAFRKAYAKQDMSKHVKQARLERRARDVSASARRNAKALAHGDIRRMNTSFIVLIAVGTVLHKTGYDKVLWEKTKDRTKKAKVWLKANL